MDLSEDADQTPSAMLQRSKVFSCFERTTATRAGAAKSSTPPRPAPDRYSIILLPGSIPYYFCVSPVFGWRIPVASTK